MSMFKMIEALFTSAPRVSAANAVARVTSGDAVLVDVREAREWTRGVANGAALLPLSDFTHERRLWREFLSRLGEREVLVYCASGGRSALVARILVSEGVKAADAGSLRDWAAAGWPIVPPPK